MSQNQTQDTLSPAQHRALEGLLSSRNLTEAAKAAGVSTRSVSRWLHEPAFQAELSAA